MASDIILPQGIDWNQFRKIYPFLSFKQLEDICDDIDFLYPVQNQSHPIHFYRMFKLLPDNLEVTELGCHQGQLAKRILEATDKIKSWVGYDFAGPLKRNLCDDERYSTVVLDRWFHETKVPKCDVFVASHVLEHLSSDQVEKTLMNVTADYFLIEVPLQKNGFDWHDWNCTHVLNWGLDDLRAFLSYHNFEIFNFISELGIIGAKKNG